VFRVWNAQPGSVVEAVSIEAFKRTRNYYLNMQEYGEKAGQWHEAMMLIWRVGADMMGQMASV